jgi:hypothetical protein
VEISWGLFSLELQNAAGPDEHAMAHASSGLALSTGAAVREVGGPEALGAYYATLGRLVHEDGRPLDQPDTVTGALDDADLDASLVDIAAADPRYADEVKAEHRALVARTRSFGVRTMVLDDGAGPAIFGPVITEPPIEDATALALFEHVVWLARYEGFSELKRDRVAAPALESVRRAEHGTPSPR